MPHHHHARVGRRRMKLLIPGGDPFYFPGGNTGCLLTHGFTGAPEEMRWLGEHLAGRGYSVLGVRLFGHGTQPEDLSRARRQDWLASLEDGYHILSGACDKIVLIGFSLGGVLCLSKASEWDLRGVVAMATPYDLPPVVSRLRPLIPLISKVWRYRQPGEASDWRDKAAEALNVNYPVQPLRAVAELYDQILTMRDRLHDLHHPALLIYSRGDKSVPQEHAEIIKAHLASLHVQLEWVENSGHSLPRDAAREQVFRLVADFVRKVTEEDPP
jgi:carboxylesterase